ncbi:MAG: glycerol-3-phosphate 1-O-acyltransferase PlsY [Deltaproteobacteria bacterium]|nr:glycerol-3-phosphate 1-O-acyltransferase PlsY [Deltaproteobacteria bacterium]
MKWLFLVAFAYLLGSVPVGILVSRFFGGEDPRDAGSGNIGATNVARTLGRLPGIVTLVGDVLKGFVPALWAAQAFSSPWAVATVGLAAFLGHVFPLYIGFKGGKGVATGLGVFLALAPGSALLAACVFGAVVWKWRIVSLASLSAAAALPLLAGFLGRPAAIVFLAAVVAGVTAWKHQGNIERLMEGTESRLGEKR